METDRVTTESDGAFDLAAVPRTDVDFETLFVQGASGIAVFAPDDHKIWIVHLHRATTVRVRLVDAAGLPIRDTAVSLAWLQETQGLPIALWTGVARNVWVSKTDHLGVAVFREIPSDYAMKIAVDDERYIQPDNKTAFTVHADLESDVHTIPVNLGGIVTGSVVFGSTGKSAPGIRVNVFPIGSGQEGIGTSDTKGNYRITGLVPGKYAIETEEATIDGIRWVAAAQLSDIQPGGSNASIRLPLMQSVTVRGKVTDNESGTPLSNTYVYAMDLSHPGDAQGLHGTSTASDGTYKLDVAPGAVFVGLTGAGLNSLDTLTKEVHIPPEGNGIADFAITAPRLFSIDGHATIELGKPAAGAVVTLTKWSHGIGEQVAETVTDTRGAFQFQPASVSARYVVQVALAGHGIFRSADLSSDQENNIAISAALVKADSFLAGSVVNRYGRPVIGAVVTSDDVENLKTHTDAKGNFRLVGLPAGQTNITITAPGGYSTSTSSRSGRTGYLYTIMTRADAETRAAIIDREIANHLVVSSEGKSADVLLADAQLRAAATGKKILLDFGSSWCGGCYFVSRYFDSPGVISILKPHFIIVKLDILESERRSLENPGGVNIYRRYGGTGSIPFWVVLDASGRNLGSSIWKGENVGLTGDATIGGHFLRTIRTAAPDIRASKIMILQQRLRHLTDL